MTRTPGPPSGCGGDLPTSRRGALAAVAALSAGAVAGPLAASRDATAATTAPPEDRATAFPAWTDLFDRTDPDGTGWLAADGIYSVALNGAEYDRAAAAAAPTLLWFSDTIVGTFEDGSRGETTLVNNSLAVIEPFEGVVPPGDHCHFHHATDANGDPAAVFEPDTPSAADGHWYWPKGGFVDAGGAVRFFAMRMRDTGDGTFGFAADGMALLTIERGSLAPIVPSIPGGGDPDDGALLAEPADQTELPLYEPGGPDVGSKQIGDAVLVNTEAAGAPDPDGYLYVYGLEDLQRETERGNADKGLLVARVRPGEVADPGAWRFWDGSAWATELGAAAPVANRAGDEMSVTPLSDGQYLHTFQLDTTTDHVAINVADRPQGPFGEPRLIYDSPVPERFAEAGNEGVFAYNAKAHPHLSPPGELLVSYNVNDTSNGLSGDSDIYDEWIDEVYQPRFVRLPDPAAAGTPTASPTATATENATATTGTDPATSTERATTPTTAPPGSPATTAPTAGEGSGTVSGTTDGTGRTESGGQPGFGLLAAAVAAGSAAAVAAARRIREG